jgi:hypothetical protein
LFEFFLAGAYIPSKPVGSQFILARRQMTLVAAYVFLSYLNCSKTARNWGSTFCPTSDTSF